MKPSRLLCVILGLVFLAIGCKKKPTGTPEALCQAARTGDIERVRSLISSGADVNARIRSAWTPLHEAAVGGHKNVAELLIAKGADVNARSHDGDLDTPLHESAAWGHKDVVELLVAKGADVGARNKQGQTALDYARKANHTDVVELLKAAGQP